MTPAAAATSSRFTPRNSLPRKEPRSAQRANFDLHLRGTNRHGSRPPGRISVRPLTITGIVWLMSIAGQAYKPYPVRPFRGKPLHVEAGGTGCDLRPAQTGRMLIKPHERNKLGQNESPRLGKRGRQSGESETTIAASKMPRIGPQRVNGLLLVVEHVLRPTEICLRPAIQPVRLDVLLHRRGERGSGCFGPPTLGGGVRWH